ncbi:MAG: hypothetical protein ACJAYV_000991 [Oleispira sp.]|jgi:hypothetical protein
MKLVKGLSILSAAILLAACGSGSSSSSDSDSDKGDNTALNVYDFPSKLISGDSSVSHSGQATRHILINEIKNLIASDEFQSAADKATALGMLNDVYAKGTKDTIGNLISTNVYTAGQEATLVNVSIKTENATLKQVDYSDVSDDKNLQGKIAGKDNLLSAGEFIGWDVITTGDDAVKGEGVNAAPELLIQEWFDLLAERAGDGDADTNYVTEEGLDLQQLVQKFLLGAVTYSQAAEDYLKLDKGLVKQNSTGDKEGKPYTSLEHQWDEGFGYFGAAHDYNLYTDAENKAQQDNDTNLDGTIDLYSEYSFGHSANAAKRDKGSADNAAATDFSKGAMDAFIAGRSLIQANYGTDPVLGEGYQVELVAISKVALENWEKAVAATVVHYINDVTADYANYGTAEFNSSNLAKHWSEMKGFALGLQFSQVPVISMADLEIVHAAFGEAPVLLGADQAAVDVYVAKLADARAVMQTAYEFDADNVANW